VAHDDEGRAGRPLLRLIRGDATPEEIAAVVALLTARASPVEQPSAPARSAWADPAERVRGFVASRPGAGAWQRSGRVPGVRTRAGW
jgi:Acyl-CoA carboxylase epsilon subunit